MNIQRQSFSTSEPCVLSAWREQLAQATQGLSQQLVQQAPQLLPRFAAYYTKLQQLPRRVRRRLQRQFRRVRRAHHFSAHGTPPTRTQSLAGVALLLALGQAPALAATINVGGGCSLVNAITAANNNATTGGCRAGSGADTIVLPAGSTHTLTTANNSTPYGPTGLPVITSTITIAGNGSAITRASSAPDFRILAVASNGDLTLRATTISGGDAPESFTTDASRGGGVFNKGRLALIDSAVARNAATSGGGGVYNTYGTLIVANSVISGNSAAFAAGLFNSGGSASLTNSTVSANFSPGGFGGGMVNMQATATLSNCTVSGNSADAGGGMFNANSRVNLTNSTVSGNTVDDDGGGMFNGLGQLTLLNSTVSGNTAGTRGGGVYSGGRFGNDRSDVVLGRSLISGNTATKGAEVYQRDGGVVTANNFNLFGHSGLTNAQALVGDIRSGTFDTTATSDGGVPTALASILNPTLANNGGLTQTHALVANSPAVDETNGCPPPATDQRGVPRPQIGLGAPQCDVGAFELVPPGTVTCDGLPATIVGTPASETITGTPGRDVIQGLGGNDVIRGLGGNDVVCGGSGNDRLFGGSGGDRLFGGAGTDRLDGELDFDRCDGGPPATGDTAARCEHVSNVP